MRPKRIIVFAVSMLIGVFGLGAGLYGLAKVASAEPKKRMDVVIPGHEKDWEVADPPDLAMRDFGFKASGVGVLCLFLSGVGIVFSMRPKNQAALPPRS